MWPHPGNILGCDKQSSTDMHVIEVSKRFVVVVVKVHAPDVIVQ